MATTTVHVKGLDGILETLKALPPEIVSKGGGPVRAALRKGAVVLQGAYVDAIRAIVAEPAPDGRPSESTGLLEKSAIVSRMKPRPGFKGEIYKLRVRRSSKYPDGTSANTVGGVLEFGDQRIQAKAPMRRSFDANKSEALSTIVSEMQKRTQAAIRKATKRSKQL